MTRDLTEWTQKYLDSINNTPRQEVNSIIRFRNFANADKTTPIERLLIVEKKTGKIANLKINYTVGEILKEHFAMSGCYDPEDWLFPTASKSGDFEMSDRLAT